MKNKIFAVLMAATVGVMSLASGTTVWARALGGDLCPSCGDYGIAPVETGREIRYFDESRECQHGHEGQEDVWAQNWVRFNYYCGDCDIHWENWEAEGWPYWRCQYTDKD